MSAKRTHSYSGSSFSGLPSFAHLIRADSTAGVLLILAAAAALIWVNTPAGDGYLNLRDTTLPVNLGFETLNLTVGEWASDALLAIFFFVVGVELKHEFVNGSLRDPKTAITPMVAAAGGVLVPALIFAGIQLVTGAGASTLHGWAIPTATDIAFATAVLGLVSKRLPSALRIFLLTLAVVDDLIAILIIAVAYAHGLAPLWLLAALVPLAVFTWLVQKHPTFFVNFRWAPWLMLFPLGMITWVCVDLSGIHATVAGVALGLIVPAKPGAWARGTTLPDAWRPLAPVLSHRIGPFSSGLAVPVFAFFAAGVPIGGASGFVNSLQDPVVWGIVLGLLIGKPLGIVGSTWLLTRTPWGRLDPRLRWSQMCGIGLMAGIGFTVALLVTELAYGHASPHTEHAKLAVLMASVLAAVLGAIWLLLVSRKDPVERTRTEVQ
ncbi:MAG: Na+/H+ antiporter NhaA [Galactobacter sp.]